MSKEEFDDIMKSTVDDSYLRKFYRYFVIPREIDSMFIHLNDETLKKIQLFIS